MDNPLLRQVADNPALFDALKEIIAAKFQGQLEEIDPETPNELLGQLVKAQIIGIRMVDEAFAEIAKYKTPPPPAQRPNGAR